jgi:hypothetical protein
MGQPPAPHTLAPHCLPLLLPLSHAALLEPYVDEERLVREQLIALVTDAALLKGYAAAAMIRFKQAIQVGGAGPAVVMTW